MNRFRLCGVLIALLLPMSAKAADYLIEFDTLAGHSPGTGATLSSVVLSPYGWRSIGDPNGGRFLNRTGKTIRAIHLKSNQASNKLKVTLTSGGRLFPTVWAKNDGSEAYFLGGNVPSGAGAFWMRVPRNTATEIQRCDSDRVCPFDGQAFENDPPEPSGEEWTKVSSEMDPIDEKWRRLIAATPSEFRDIQSYGESGDGRHVLFVSNGQLLLFNHAEGTLSQVPIVDATLPTINRISSKGEEFHLWRSGAVMCRVLASDAKLLGPDRSNK